MGLIGDLREAKQLWCESSWQFRGLIVFASFLAISPIASLADVIFEWKGFFLDALNFYKQRVSTPIREFASSFGLEWSQQELDVLILMAMLITGMQRVGTAESITFLQIWGKLGASLTFGGFLGMAIGLGYLHDDTQTTTVFIIFLLAYALVAFIFYRLSPRDMLMFCAPTLICLVIILICGAVNEGLSR